MQTSAGESGADEHRALHPCRCLTLSLCPSCRCSTHLGTDRRAGVFCSGPVPRRVLLSGPPDGRCRCLSHGIDARPPGPPRGAARSQPHRSPSPGPGGEQRVRWPGAGRRPSGRREGNAALVQPERLLLGTDSPQGENIPDFQRQLHRVLGALPKEHPALSLPHPEEPFHRPSLSAPDCNPQRSQWHRAGQNYTLRAFSPPRHLGKL